MSKCVQCEKELLPIETSLSRKLLGTDTKEFYCKECLSSYLSVSVKSLDELIEYFKKTGCYLFKTK